MSLYKDKLRERLGIKEKQNPLYDLSEEQINSILEILDNRISEESEGMEDPAAAGDEIPNVDDAPEQPEQPSSNISTGDITGSITEEDRDAADGMYNEVLQYFRERVAKCDEAKHKNMWRKAYEMCYKMREKFISEMTSEEH